MNANTYEWFRNLDIENYEINLVEIPESFSEDYFQQEKVLKALSKLIRHDRFCKKTKLKCDSIGCHKFDVVTSAPINAAFIAKDEANKSAGLRQVPIHYSRIIASFESRPENEELNETSHSPVRKRARIDPDVQVIEISPEKISKKLSSKSHKNSDVKPVKSSPKKTSKKESIKQNQNSDIEETVTTIPKKVSKRESLEPNQNNVSLSPILACNDSVQSTSDAAVHSKTKSKKKRKSSKLIEW